MDIPWACVKFRTSFDAFQKRENLDRIKRRTQQSNIWKTKNYFSWWVKKKREKKTNELYNNNLTATATKIIKLSEWTERCAFLFPALISRRAGAWIIILYIWMLHIMKNNTRSLWKKKRKQRVKICWAYRTDSEWNRWIALYVFIFHFLVRFYSLGHETVWNYIFTWPFSISLNLIPCIYAPIQTCF